jgi:ketosteroid isomerase-like protein
MIDERIAALEEELRAAQLASDVATLDRLISGDLLFTGPDGRLASKHDDLAAHRGGIIRMRTHEPEDMRMRRVGDDVVVVALRTRVAGEYAGQPFDGIVRYTRVWARETDGEWRIVAGHVAPVAAGPPGESGESGG